MGWYIQHVKYDGIRLLNVVLLVLHYYLYIQFFPVWRVKKGLAEAVWKRARDDSSNPKPYPSLLRFFRLFLLIFVRIASIRGPPVDGDAVEVSRARWSSSRSYGGITACAQGGVWHRCSPWSSFCWLWCMHGQLVARMCARSRLPAIFTAVRTAVPIYHHGSWSLSVVRRTDVALNELSAATWPKSPVALNI